MFTLQAGARHGVAVAFQDRDSGDDRQGYARPPPTAENRTATPETAGPWNAAYAFQPRIARNGRGGTGGIVNALNAQSGRTGKGDAAPCVALAVEPPGRSSQAAACESDIVAARMLVRRLTPVEAERLQGFPDFYTAIPWRSRPAAECPDGPHYRALGNSMAVNVMRWIGERIKAMLDAEQNGDGP
jgi:site-specific DNA-cytosine methylase